MSRKWRWIAAGMLVVAGLLGLALLRRPVDDLAFLEQWHPIRETRVGDISHPGDPAFGTWTVLRFRRPDLVVYTERGVRSMSGTYEPDLEWQFHARLRNLFVAHPVYDRDYVATVKSPTGGSNRYLWVGNGMFSSNPDRYQVWIRQDSWVQRTWVAIRHHLGL